MNTFDEASAATEEMFNKEQAPQEEITPSETEGQENQQQSESETPRPVENQSELNDAVNTAEAAAQAAAEKDNQLNQAMLEIEALKKQYSELQGQNQQLQGTIDELSQQNEQNIIEEVLQPPTLDVNGLAFADEETVRQAQQKYASEMTEYTKNQLMKELSPAIEYAKQGMREKEKAEAMASLSQLPELSGIQDMLPQLDRIIEKNKWLQSEDMPADERYINAYALAKGVDSINTPPEPKKELNAQELFEIYQNSPELQELIEKDRISKVKPSQQVPAFSASSGAVNAALNIKEPPKNFDEAFQRTIEDFRG